MRIELHFFLWVIALLGCFGAISYGSAGVDYLPYRGQLGSAGHFPFMSQEPEQLSTALVQIPDLAATSIFPSALVPVTPDAVIVDLPLPALALKGIVELEGATKAILAGEAGEYATIGVGETFLDATVLSLTSDGALLSRRDGSEVKLLLRGAGELP